MKIGLPKSIPRVSTGISGDTLGEPTPPLGRGLSFCTASYVSEQIASVPNMNNTGRLPSIALVHIGMEIRLTNTVEAPEAVTDSTGVVIGMDLDPVDVSSRKNTNLYVGEGGVNPKLYPEILSTPWGYPWKVQISLKSIKMLKFQSISSSRDPTSVNRSRRIRI